MIDKIVNEATSAVSASIEGADDIMTAVRTTVKNQLGGAVTDVKEVGGTTVDAVSSVASGSIKAAASVGTDLGDVAVGTVEGAMSGAGEVGMTGVEVTKAAIMGVIDAADEVGSEAGESVRKALLSAASLPKDVVESVIGK